MKREYDMTILEELFALRDEGYAAFQSKLTPTIPSDCFIGVRVPELRTLAKKLKGFPETAAFLSALPHTYYDENMLHSLLLSQEKEYAAAVAGVDAFLPYVDNWAVCDVLSPKAFRTHKTELLPKICEWSSSPLSYTCRFGIEMLMSHYLDGDFAPEYLEIPAAVRSEEYYVRMMVAWFFATALAKQWAATVPYSEQNRLDVWTHNKTIQKACESYRITDEQKRYLRGLKRLK